MKKRKKTVYLELFIAWDNSITRSVAGVKGRRWTLINLSAFQLTLNNMEILISTKLYKDLFVFSVFFLHLKCQFKPLTVKSAQLCFRNFLSIVFCHCSLFPTRCDSLTQHAIVKVCFCAKVFFYCNDLKNNFEWGDVYGGFLTKGKFDEFEDLRNCLHEIIENKVLFEINLDMFFFDNRTIWNIKFLK